MTSFTRADFERKYGIRNDGQAHLGPVRIDDMSAEELFAAHENPSLQYDVRRYAYNRMSMLIAYAQDDVDTAIMHKVRMFEAYLAMPRACRW